jgi:uncharacterized protein
MAAERMLDKLAAIPAAAIVWTVRCYQATLSGLIGRQCRFTPTCSEYFIESVETCGVFRGVLKGLWRIARCNPWGKSGYDPVIKPTDGASK